MKLVKFFVIEYAEEIYGPSGSEFKIIYRLFDYERDQPAAEKFCSELKESGIAVNIRTRSIDTNLFM